MKRRTVVHFSDSTEFGGTEQVILHLLGGLDQTVWAPVLLHHGTPGTRRLVDGARECGVECQVVPPVWRRGDAVTGLLPLIRTIRRIQPAVFHAHLTSALGGKYALLAARLARVPVVLGTVHLYLSVGPSRRLTLSHRVSTACVDRYIAVSHQIARSLHERFGVPEAKMQVIHNGIPRLELTSDVGPAFRATLGAVSGQQIVLNLARLDTQKGQRFLLEAAAQRPEPLYLIAGEGPLRADLQQQAQLLGLKDQVRFLGFRTDRSQLIGACDLFVLPSLDEGLPLALLEAMAAGKPVVACGVGGVGEVITHGVTGVLVPPADSRALAEAIGAVLSDRVLAERLGKAARERVETSFTCETMVHAVVGVYLKLLEAKSRSRAR
jgi:glycosyltransferase involved in cell wall biosynthesis